MLARAWFTARLFRLSLTYERQINTAILWFLWSTDVLSSTEQATGWWGQIDIGAKYRTLLHHRLQTQHKLRGTPTGVSYEIGNFIQQTTFHHKANGYRWNWITCVTLRMTGRTFHTTVIEIMHNIQTLNLLHRDPTPRDDHTSSDASYMPMVPYGLKFGMDQPHETPVSENVKMEWYRAIHNSNKLPFTQD